MIKAERERRLSLSLFTCSSYVCPGTHWDGPSPTDRTLTSSQGPELQERGAQPCLAASPEGNPTTRTKGSFQKEKDLLRLLCRVNG